MLAIIFSISETIFRAFSRTEYTSINEKLRDFYAEKRRLENLQNLQNQIDK
jgi:hypothetical protein